MTQFLLDEQYRETYRTFNGLRIISSMQLEPVLASHTEQSVRENGGRASGQAEAVEDFSRVVRWVDYRQPPETAPASAQLSTSRKTQKTFPPFPRLYPGSLQGRYGSWQGRDGSW
jgi:hypothetical protein